MTAMPVRTRDLQIERGPDWLLLRVLDLNRCGDRYDGEDAAPDESANEDFEPVDGGYAGEPLAERLWRLMDEHGLYRLVLELGEVDVLDSVAVRQLTLLHEFAGEQGGFLRLCGLSPRRWQILTRNGLGDIFQPYGNRDEAAFAAHRPSKPR
jgi:anti-anti-sigma regulatory factor